MKTLIGPEIWSDPEFEDLSHDEKLSILWLLTNSRRDLCGFVEVGEKRFEFETGLSMEALRRACQGLTKGFIEVEEGLFWAKNFVEYQFGKGEKLSRNNLSKSILKHLSRRSDEARALFFDQYPELKDMGLSLCVIPPLTQSPYQGLAKGKEKEKVKEKVKENRPSDVTQPLDEGSEQRSKWPSLEVVKNYASSPACGVAANVAEIWWHDMESSGWVDKRGLEVVNWRSSLKSYGLKWQANDFRGSLKKPSPGNQSQRPGEYRIGGRSVNVGTSESLDKENLEKLLTRADKKE